MFFKKATKIDEIFTVYLTLRSRHQIDGEDFVIFGTLVKKLEIEKTKTTKNTKFKTDIIKVVLVFSISNFFTNENSQGRKLSAV
jgi:hypothetical protein